MKWNIFFLVFILLFSAKIANSEEMRLDWRDQTDRKEKVGFTVYVGGKSRNYDRKKVFPKGTLAVNVSDLPLKTDVANYISAMIDGESRYSTEIVILWAGDNPDSDGDGLSDSFEKTIGTRPDKKDTDDDGIPDGEEYATWGAKRWNLDYNENGIMNLLDPDSDGDGILDGEDSDIRRIPSFFRSSKVALGNDNTTFIQLYQRRKVKSEERIGGSVDIAIAWTFNEERKGIRYRIYSRTKEEKFYDLNQWETETTQKKTSILNLYPDKIYYFVVRGFYPDGSATSMSPDEFMVDLPRLTKAELKSGTRIGVPVKKDRDKK